jgi:hypothetical protein
VTPAPAVDDYGAAYLPPPPPPPPEPVYYETYYETYDAPPVVYGPPAYVAPLAFGLGGWAAGGWGYGHPYYGFHGRPEFHGHGHGWRH